MIILCYFSHFLIFSEIINISNDSYYKDTIILLFSVYNQLVDLRLYFVDLRLVIVNTMYVCVGGKYCL